MTIHVREFRPSDELRIAELREQATVSLRRTYRPSATLIAARDFDEHRWQILVAVVSSRVVGTVECRQLERVLHMRFLAVDPEYQRTGVARGLIAYLLQYARRAGAVCLALQTIAETGNVLIFERLGFRAVEARPAEGFESDSHSALVEVCMELSIEENGSDENGPEQFH